MFPRHHFRALLLSALLTLVIALNVAAQGELPNVLPFSWSFINFSTNLCSPPESFYTWERYRETYIGIPSTRDVASGFDKLFFDKAYEKKLGTLGHCYGMSLMALQIEKKGGHLGFCAPVGQYSGDVVGAPPILNDGCDAEPDANQWLGPTSLELRRAIEETHGHQLNLASIRHVMEVLAENAIDGLSAYAQVQAYAPAIISLARDASEPFGAAHAMVAYAAREVSGEKRIYVYDPNRSVASTNPNSTHPDRHLLDQVEWYTKGDNYIRIGDDGSWTFRAAGWEMELDDDGDPVLDDDGNAVVHEITWPIGVGLIYAVPLSVAGPRDRNPLSMGMSVTSLLSTIFLSGSGATLKQVTAPGGKIAFIPGTKKLELSPAKCLLEVFPLVANDGVGFRENGVEPYILLSELAGARDFEVQLGNDGYAFELAHAGGRLVVAAQGGGRGTDTLRIADHESREPKLTLFNRSGTGAYELRLEQRVDAGSTRTFRLESLSVPADGVVDLRLHGDGNSLAVTSPTHDVRFDLVVETTGGDRPRQARVDGLSVAAQATALVQPGDWSDLKSDSILGGARPMTAPELEQYQRVVFAKATSGPVGLDFAAAVDVTSSGMTSAAGRTVHDARSDVYTQTSSGNGLAADGDSLHFAYTRVRGDFELTVEIISRGEPAAFLDPLAHRGIIARADLSPTARSSYLALALDDKKVLPRWLYRHTQGEAEALIDRHRFAVGGDEPKFLKLVRRGATLFGFVSADNKRWTPAGSNTWYGLAPGAELFVGFASTTGAGRSALSTTFRVHGFGSVDPPLEALLPDDGADPGAPVYEQTFTGPDGSLPVDFIAWAKPSSPLASLQRGRLRLSHANAADSAATAFRRDGIGDLEQAVYQFDFDVFFTPGRSGEPAGGVTFTLAAVDGDLDDAALLPGGSDAQLGFEGLGGSRELVRGILGVELDLVGDGLDAEGAFNGLDETRLHVGINSHDQSASVVATASEIADPYDAGGIHVTVVYNRGEVSVAIAPGGETPATEPVLKTRLLPLGFRSESSRVFLGFTASTGSPSASVHTAEVDDLVVTKRDCGDAPEEAVILGAPAQAVPVGALVTLDGSASRAGSSDVGRERVAHFWEIVAGAAVIDGPNWGPTVHVRPTADGIVIVRLTADDGVCENASGVETSFIADGSIAVFHRGDVDDNNAVQITDAVRILGYLFLGQAEPACLDAADADDNGSIQITDAVRVLSYLFLGSGTIAPPGPPGEPCGPDPIGSPSLGCKAYESCQ